MMDENDDYFIDRDADELIMLVVAHGPGALTTYMSKLVDSKDTERLMHALLVTERVAWKLCQNKDRYAVSCPAVEGSEDARCPRCYVAGEAALMSGVCGVLWRERI